MGTRPQESDTGVAGSAVWPGRDGPRRVDSLGRRWTDEAEQLFLDELGASANVARAVQATGFCSATVYRRRRGDAGFDRRWREALAQGFDRLETLLLQRATEALEGRLPDPEHPIPAMTIAEIIRILQMHRAEVRGVGPKAAGGHARPASLDERRHSIIARLEAIAAADREEARHADAAASGDGPSGDGPSGAESIREGDTIGGDTSPGLACHAG